VYIARKRRDTHDQHGMQEMLDYIDSYIEHGSSELHAEGGF
jgi:hypothetical protein